jgi:NitT/TauT family transport system ATP-binding protein
VVTPLRSVAATLPADSPWIEARGLGKDFVQPRLGQPTRVLDEVSFSVAPNEFVAVVGPTGCGKTTLLHLTDGLIAPTRGAVLVAGRPVSGPGRDRALVFQGPALLPWRTALANIAYGLECLRVPRPEAQAVAREWLGRVRLDGFGHHYPHELSGGMQQRANLARALAVDPAILLMDEPFTSLDEQTREAMQAELLQLWTDSPKTVLFVTHLISEAVYLADRIVVLTGRPARVRETVAVGLPRPRRESLRSTAHFRECEAEVRALLAADLRGTENAPSADGRQPGRTR